MKNKLLFLSLFYALTFYPSLSIATTPLAQQSSGKIIGYLATWKPYPDAKALRDAGYTNITYAFGVFDKLHPGKIILTSSDLARDKAYIDSLHAVGIKVSLSIGGASTSLPDTTVSFDEVLQKAPSHEQFKKDFIDSFTGFINQGLKFDGLDIDIESGLDPQGTFDKPTGDIQVLADIINQLHHQNPSLLISLAPQTLNVAPNWMFAQQTDNYAALIKQTHDALSWVGIQLYNTGGMFGIDGKIHENPGTTPEFSVAMATALLEKWPDPTPSIPWNHYLPLRPDQVVIGYLAPNKQGKVDGNPYTSTKVIKNALRCLKTGADCIGYQPPHVYPSFGGVFEWELSYDQDNNFKFATDLKECVIQGICSTV